MPPVTTISRKLLIVAVLLLFSTMATAQRVASLRGQVTDQFGAVIVAASVTLVDQSGKEQTTQSDDRSTSGSTQYQATPGSASGSTSSHTQSRGS